MSVFIILFVSIFGDDDCICALEWLTINISGSGECVFNEAELEVGFRDVLLIYHISWRSLVVLFLIIWFESCIFTKFSFWNAVQCTSYLANFENAEHDTLNVSFLLRSATVEAFVVIFFGMDDYFMWTFVLADSESVYPLNRKLAMLYKVQWSLLQRDQMLARDDQDAVLLEAVPVELLNVTTVEN